MNVRLRFPENGSSWRDFLAEVGIVVLGVLIALAAEQLVSNHLQRQEAVYTEAALKAELGQAAGHAIERLAIGDCMRNRLAHLDAKLRREGPHWTADPLKIAPNPNESPALPSVYRAIRRPWTSDVWQMAISTGIIRHIPRERLKLYSGVYHAVRRMREINDREYATIARLGPLRSDRTLDPAFASEANVALTELDMANTAVVGGAYQLLNGLREMKLSYTQEEIPTPRVIAAARRRFGTCVKDVSVAL